MDLGLSAHAALDRSISANLWPFMVGFRENNAVKWGAKDRTL